MRSLHSIDDYKVGTMVNVLFLRKLYDFDDKEPCAAIRVRRNAAVSPSSKHLLCICR